jgi:hypothetical protein
MAIPKCVPNYNELRKVHPPLQMADGEYVFVAGLPDPKDHGLEGFFSWRPHALNADNGGTVIKPNGFPDTAPGRWRRVSSGGYSVKWFGAVGDGVADDTDAIQAAEDAAASGEHEQRLLVERPSRPSVVVFPPGVYVINGQKAPIPNDSRKYGILKKSTRWVGQGYSSSILKLQNNSTVSPSGIVDPQMIFANGRLNDVGFFNLGFDLNGANNPLTQQANVAAVWFEGEQLEINGMIVEGCKFYHGPGGTIILVENPATAWTGHQRDYPLDDVLILNNRFEDNCLSKATDDHSTINIWARRTRVIGNAFQQTPAVPAPQHRYFFPAAIEFHGADGLFLGNTIRSYGSAVIASENFIEPWRNLLIANNVVSDLGRCFVATEVSTAAQSPHSKPIDNIVVRNNYVVFNNDTHAGTIKSPNSTNGEKVGLLLLHGLPISYIEVSDNYFEMLTPDSQTRSVGVRGVQIEDDPQTTQDESADPSDTIHLKVSGNTFNKMTFGVWIDNYSFHVRVHFLEFENNTCLNMQDLSTNQKAAGVWANGAVAQHLRSLSGSGNRFLNEANTVAYLAGFVFAGYIDDSNIAGNVFYNVPISVNWP